MVDSLLIFKATTDAILSGPFHSNVDLVHKTNDAFETFVNKRANKPAEMLAKYIDAKMRGGNKGSSEAEVEAVLNRVLALFRYTSGQALTSQLCFD